MLWRYDDGGRAAAGYKGHAGDCVARSIAIASGLPYADVYEALAAGQGSQRLSSRDKRRGRTRHVATARAGINVKRKWFKDYMASIGFVWTPTMAIGSGCTVHLHDGELPAGRLVVSLSRHYTAVIDGVIHDTFDPQRETHCVENYTGQALRPGQWLHRLGDRICWIERRCVYGYWRQA